jgi:hypothetical protein
MILFTREVNTIMRDNIIHFLQEIEAGFAPTSNVHHSISLYGSTEQLVLHVKGKDRADIHFIEENDFEDSERLVAEIRKVSNGE